MLLASPGSLPWRGETFSVDVGDLPVSFSIPFAMVGFSGTFSDTLGVPLPFPLDSVGYFGCTLHVDPVVTVTLVPTAGSAPLDIPIPPDASLVGFEFFVQGGVVETFPFLLSLTLPYRGVIGTRNK